MTTPQPAPASPLAPAWLPAPGDPDALAPGLWAAGVDRSEFDAALLTHATESELLAQLAEFPAVVAAAARLREPHRVARHLEVIAGAYHSWYAACRIVPMPTDDGTPRPVEPLTRPRLWLNDATAEVLANGLGLLGVSAPEKM